MKFKTILAAFICGVWFNVAVAAAPQDDADGETGATTSYKKQNKKAPEKKTTTPVKKKQPAAKAPKTEKKVTKKKPARKK